MIISLIKLRFFLIKMILRVCYGKAWLFFKETGKWTFASVEKITSLPRLEVLSNELKI